MCSVSTVKPCDAQSLMNRGSHRTACPRYSEKDLAWGVKHVHVCHDRRAINVLLEVLLRHGIQSKF